MSEITKQQKMLMDKAIEQAQEVTRLREELAKTKAERDAIQATMDAVIAAFLRSGAPAPNVDAECWGKKVYRIVQNEGFFTISRTDEELEREGQKAAGSGLTGSARRSLTAMQRARARDRSRRITAFVQVR